MMFQVLWGHCLGKYSVWRDPERFLRTTQLQPKTQPPHMLPRVVASRTRGCVLFEFHLSSLENTLGIPISLRDWACLSVPKLCIFFQTTESLEIKSLLDCSLLHFFHFFQFSWCHLCYYARADSLPYSQIHFCHAVTYRGQQPSQVICDGPQDENEQLE